MANSYLNRTPSGAGSRTTWTFSAWIKRTTSSTGHQIFDCSPTPGTDESKIYIYNDFLYWKQEISNTADGYLVTNRKFRDTNAWYHIVCQWNTTNATASERMKIWINGVQETSFSTNNLPDQNRESYINSTTAHYIGSGQGSGSFFDGYMSHVAFVDGSIVAPTVFGETDSTSGIWKFKSPSGVTWGTNGFHLKFENSGALGTDSSGNSNTFTVNGNLKQALDTPSNVYATLNPLNVPTSNAPTFSFGNTKTITMNTDPGYFGGTSTLGASSGKYYAEFKVTDNNGVGALGITFNPAEKARQGTTFSAQISDSFIYANNAKQYSTATGTSGSSYGNTYTDNDIIGVAMDLDNSKLYFHKNGTYQNSGVPTSGSTGTGAISITAGETYFFYLTDVGGATATYECNFGNGHFGTTAITSAGSNGNGSLFEYDVPSGYYALNTKNINTYG
jgi:hypothetical protein